jgi:hypothetical protein
MLNAEIRFIVDGHGVSSDSFVQSTSREVRTAVREEIALKVIRTFRVGRRVLIPMKTVDEVVSKGIALKRIGKSIG